MRKRSDIHAFEDLWFLDFVRCVGAWVLGLGLMVTAGIGIALALFAPGLIDAPFVCIGGVRGVGLWIVATTAATLAALVLHEGVHAVCFKLLAARPVRVAFGSNLEHGMLYASAAGVRYPRRSYLAIALAPTVVVTLAIAALGTACACPMAALLVGTLHLSGCAGDWGYVRAIVRDPGILVCEDTDFGVCFYGADEEMSS